MCIWPRKLDGFKSNTSSSQESIDSDGHETGPSVVVVYHSCSTLFLHGSRLKRVVKAACWTADFRFSGFEPVFRQGRGHRRRKAGSRTDGGSGLCDEYRNGAASLYVDRYPRYFECGIAPCA